MLGRLEMSVDECITAYGDLTAAVFREKLHHFPFGITWRIKSHFDSTRLKSTIQGMLT